MTRFDDVTYYGPGAEEAEARRKRTLDVQAQRAAGQQQKIQRFIDGTGPDPETGTAIVSPGQTAEAPKPDPKAALLAKLTKAKGKLDRLRRRTK